MSKAHTIKKGLNTVLLNLFALIFIQTQIGPAVQRINTL